MKKSLKNKVSQEEFTLLPADSHMAKEYILNHIVDAAFIGSRLCSNSMLNYHHLYDECLMLCVPENLLNAYEGLPEKSESPKIPFILPRTHGTRGQGLHRLSRPGRRLLRILLCSSPVSRGGAGI